MLRTHPRRLFAGVLAVLSLGLGGMAVAPPATARTGAPPPKVDAEDLTGAALSESSRAGSHKATTARTVTSDKELLAASGSEPTAVVIKFDYDSIAAYQGGLQGLPATSPAATDEPVSQAVAHDSAYANHVEKREAQVVAGIRKAVPAARIGRSFRVVYGGVAAVVPANQAKALLAVDGVVAVQRDDLNQQLTDSSTTFIGAPTVWAQEGGQATAGNGVLFASLDSGVWPEHPSFADNGNTPAAPNDTSDNPLECDFGDNPLTPANDPFVCNDKLVGGHAFIDTYNAVTTTPEFYPDSARDSDGHGTHTASTSAGSIAEASIFGVDRGEISGVAPGAWVDVFKVCGEEGCYSSDSTAAVEQAILDGVDVINYSISGGHDPSSDPVELAFLDAFDAGVFVAASAGNSGPDPSTTDHLSPWVTTVAASTQTREFSSTLTLTSTDTATIELHGSTITDGVAADTPVIMAEDVAGYAGDEYCGVDFPAADSLDGKIVACARGGDFGRVQKGYNAAQAGAEGMILYNKTLQDTETDNHWLPTVHLADGADFLAFMGAHAGVTAHFTAGVKQDGQGDVMASFSSRGPGGLNIKPDITAPGVQILAGHTPTPQVIDVGPPGEYFQAIAGTSMSSPHIAGSAALLKALHPDWSPQAIKSAMMLTSETDVVKEDLTTPADPFDDGAGRVDLTVAGDPGLVLDETAQNMLDLGLDPLTAIHVNQASINAPVMPGSVTTTRTFTNTGESAATYAITTQAGPGSAITVDPQEFTIQPGGTKSVEITITSENQSGAQEFGSISLTASGRPDLHMPVAFVGQPGKVQITPGLCSPAAIKAFLGETSCAYTVDNLSTTDTTIDLSASGIEKATVTGADLGATVTDGEASVEGVELEGGVLGEPSLADGAGPAGYIPLTSFGTPATAIGDEEIVNFNVPSFSFNGKSYSSLGVVSNGYIVVGGGTAQDVDYLAQEMPDQAVPNNVLAPFWTDLDGTDAPGFYITTLTDGVDTWIVVQWNVDHFGTADEQTFQVWIGIDGNSSGEQDISFAYDPGNLPEAAAGADAVVGAENEDGSGGDNLGLNVNPTTDQVITSTEPSPGAHLTWNVLAKGDAVGTAKVRAALDSPVNPGIQFADDTFEVQPLPAPEIWTDPQDLSTFAGSTAMFDASAKGAAGVRWEVSTDDGDSWEPIEGATTPHLEFTAQRSDDGNLYRAVFDNGTGQETATDSALLTVRYADPEGFVMKLYDAVLDREPDQPGFDFWVAVVESGANRDGVAQLFAMQPESRRHFVDEAYMAILGRHADPGGSSYWVKKLNSGLAGWDLYATLAASNEGYAHQGGTAAQAASHYYMLWFDSAGNSAGRNFWAAAISQDNTPAGRRRVALRGFARTARAGRIAASRAADECMPVELGDAVLTELATRYASTKGDLPRLTASAVALGCQLDE